MYTDLTNKMHTGFKSRFTGFDSAKGTKATAEQGTKVSWVGSALKFLTRAFDRVGTYPAVEDSLFGLNAYLAGDLNEAEMAGNARRVALEAPKGADPRAKAYGHYDYFDMLADHGYMQTATAVSVAKRIRARQHRKAA